MDSKKLKFERLEKTLKSLIDKESHLISNMANFSRAVADEFNYHWVGFYFVEDELLHLGPYVGPLACNQIPFAKGVCGHAWSKKNTIIVDDVHKFPNHIACSSLTNSEMVVPLIKDGEVIAVLDIDSTSYKEFDEMEQNFFESFVRLLV